MKERLLDVVKYGLILIIAGAIFYAVYPKYYFFTASRFDTIILKGNKMTGRVETIGLYRGDASDTWQILGKTSDDIPRGPINLLRKYPN